MAAPGDGEGRIGLAMQALDNSLQAARAHLVSQRRADGSWMGAMPGGAMQTALGLVATTYLVAPGEPGYPEEPALIDSLLAEMDPDGSWRAWSANRS